MTLESLIFLSLLIINILAYSLMWIDKLKSIYRWWRISEKTLWIFALCGGVFGIWLGMQWPMYHKAGKRAFRIGIPILSLIWLIFGSGLLVYFIK